MQAHTQSITLLRVFQGSFVITGTSDGRVSIWTFEFEEAFTSGARARPSLRCPSRCCRASTERQCSSRGFDQGVAPPLHPMRALTPHHAITHDNRSLRGKERHSCGWWAAVDRSSASTHQSFPPSSCGRRRAIASPMSRLFSTDLSARCPWCRAHSSPA